MRREVTVADVECLALWRLKLIMLGEFFRVELYNPDGVLRMQKSLVKDVDDVLAFARGFLVGEKLDHVGAALVQMARAELRMSGVA